MDLHIGPKDLLQNGSMGRITYGSKSVKLDGVPFREVVNLSGRSTEETLTEPTVGDDGNIYLPGGPVPEAVKRAVKRQRAKEAPRSQEPKRQEKFSVEDEEILTETEVGDDGNIYLPGGPVPEAVKRMRAQQEDRSQKAGEPVSGKVFNEVKTHQVFNEVKTHQGVRSRAVQNLVPYIDDIVEKAVLLDTYSMGVEKLKSENSLLMHSLYAVTDPGNGKYVVKLYVEEMNNPNSSNTGKRAYKLLNIKRQQPGVEGSGRNPSLITQTADIKSVANLFEAVKRADRNFRPGVSSKVVDEDGRPMAVYHGTDRGFWSFDPELGAYWFSREIDYAQAMAEERGGERVLSAYISMKDPKENGVTTTR